jgi:hypothetical protein
MDCMYDQLFDGTWLWVNLGRQLLQSVPRTLGRTPGKDIRCRVDARSGTCCVRQAAQHSGRQWQPIHLAGVRSVGLCQWRCPGLQPTWKTNGQAFIESLNGRVQLECLNQHWFLKLDDARKKIELWRQDYNDVRPHSAIGERPPMIVFTAHTNDRMSSTVPEALI